MPCRKMAHAGNPVRTRLQLGQQKLQAPGNFYFRRELTRRSDFNFVLPVWLESGVLDRGDCTARLHCKA
jgi:hypothetical protein